MIIKQESIHWTVVFVIVFIIIIWTWQSLLILPQPIYFQINILIFGMCLNVKSVEFKSCESRVATVQNVYIRLEVNVKIVQTTSFSLYVLWIIITNIKAIKYVIGHFELWGAELYCCCLYQINWHINDANIIMIFSDWRILTKY